MPQIESNAGILSDVISAGRADAPIQNEHLSLIRADVPVQVELLHKITTALGEIKPYISDTALLDKATSVTKELRAELTSPQPRNDLINKYWFQFMGALCLLLMNHFLGTVGDDLGHAVAQKIIEVVSELVRHMPPGLRRFR
jgi:hypothetical protein